MHTLNIRGINDTLYEKIKKESQKKGTSINKLLVSVLSDTFNQYEPIEYHDLDDFFGSWSEQDYKDVTQASHESRTIDEEIWK